MLTERRVDIAIWSVWACLMMGVIFWVVALFVGDQIPRDQLTKTTMGVIQRRIEDYSLKYRHLPKELSDLPKKLPRDFYDDALADAWGKPIQYQPHPDGTVVLVSHGASGGDSISYCFRVVFGDKE